MPRIASALVVAVVMVATGFALAGPAGAAPPPGGTYVPVAGSRVVDTRGSAPDTEVTIPPATLQAAGVPCG
jgi:hypothetical protein